MKATLNSGTPEPIVGRPQDVTFSLGAALDQLAARFSEIEPVVMAFVEEDGRFERLRRQAAELESRYPNVADRPTMYGAMLGVKDIFHVDGFPTRAGTAPPTESLSGPEAPAVTLLRQAGALVVGKTVTTEFAYFAPGPTRNPHSLEHTPGGSSSGSAAAVAAGLCDVALGTQTIGSVIRPAAFCGVVGFKPTYARIPRVGMIPLAPSFDHVGVFTRVVNDLRVVARLLCQDWYPAGQAERPIIGIPEGPYLEKASQEGLNHFWQCVEHLEGLGYTVKRIKALTNFRRVRERHHLILAGEAARVHARWFPEFVEEYHRTTLALIRRGQSITDDTLLKARQEIPALRRTLMDLMDAHHLDMWITPAAPGPAQKGLESTGDPVMNLPWTQSGLPAIGIPAGSNSAGLPLGIQLVGRWNEDERLLSQAEQIEKSLSAWAGNGRIRGNGHMRGNGRPGKGYR